MGGFITVRGVQLHYVVLGPEESELPPAVLLHGNGATAHDFIDSGVAKLLARERRVIIFDRPGAGYSERPRGRVWTVRRQAEFIGEALRELGIVRPVVVGHSFGTLVALALAVDKRNELSGLVLISGYYYPTFRLDALLFALPAIPVVGDVWRYTVAPLAGWLMAPGANRKVFAPSPVPRSFEAFPGSLSLRPSQLRAVGADSVTMLAGAAGLSRHYAELRIPVAIIAGTGDQIVDAAQSKRLHNDIQGSALHLIAGTGHMAHYLNPPVVAAAIDAVDGGRALSGKPVSIAQALRVRESAHAAWCESGEPTDRFTHYLHEATTKIRDDEAAYDKALADSFPASDPPAHSGITKQ
jgi:pimeloyl-ACP methyl ester carboxylesterase